LSAGQAIAIIAVANVRPPADPQLHSICESETKTIEISSEDGLTNESGNVQLFTLIADVCRGLN